VFIIHIIMAAMVRFNHDELEYLVAQSGLLATRRG
jgi:hypothetical protein